MKDLKQQMKTFIDVSKCRLDNQANMIEDSIDFEIFHYRTDLIRFATMYHNVATNKNAEELILNYCSLYYPDQLAIRLKIKRILKYFFTSCECYKEPIDDEITKKIEGSVYQVFDKKTGSPIRQFFEATRNISWNDNPFKDINYNLPTKMEQPQNNLSIPNNWIHINTPKAQVEPYQHFEFLGISGDSITFRTINYGHERVIVISNDNSSTIPILLTANDIKKMIPFFQYYVDNGRFPELKD